MQTYCCYQNSIPLKLPNYKSCTFIVKNVTPYPIDKHHQAASEIDQQHQMDKHPGEPTK